MTFFTPKNATTCAAFTVALLGSTAFADNVILDDLIVDGSACIGTDCANGESFGFDTLRLKENNLRIQFDDTSAAGGFPNTDWQIYINDSANGGANRFSVIDTTNSKTPFTIEANSPNNTLYVDAAGRLGVGTASPAVNLHVTHGNSPSLRLDQDGSSGFAPQIWDIAGNETNFFLRDVTNGSALPLRVKPNSADDSFVITPNNKIGMGTQSPAANLHMKSNAGAALTDEGLLYVEKTGSAGAVHTMAAFSNDGDTEINIINTNAAALTERWKLATQNGDFRIITPTTPGAEFSLSNTGSLTILGDFVSGATTLNVPDYVFAEDYELMPLAQVEAFILSESHLPKIPSALEIKEKGINMSHMQMALLEKVEELTLYTLEQEKRIQAMEALLKTNSE
jgi:hypothetical protein